jgi:hypothetical protein
MNSFHFSVGNSADGHIGLCARVKADTKEEAVDMLKQFLDGFAGDVELHKEDRDGAEAHGVEYCNVYLNPDALKAGDIDEINDGEPS